MWLNRIRRVKHPRRHSLDVNKTQTQLSLVCFEDNYRLKISISFIQTLRVHSFRWQTDVFVKPQRFSSRRQMFAAGTNLLSSASKPLPEQVCNKRVGSTRAQRCRADKRRDVGLPGIKFNYPIATKQQTIRTLWSKQIGNSSDRLTNRTQYDSFQTTVPFLHVEQNNLNFY